MKKYLLDTNILLAYLRKNHIYEYAEAMLQLTAPDVQLIISVVTVAEIQVLAKRNNWGETKLKELNNALNSFFVIDINIGAPELIAAYVEIDTFSKGKSMGKNDLWIAATAVVTKATLVTSDKDFDHLAPDFLQIAQIQATMPK